MMSRNFLIACAVSMTTVISWPALGQQLQKFYSLPEATNTERQSTNSARPNAKAAKVYEDFANYVRRLDENKRQKLLEQYSKTMFDARRNKDLAKEEFYRNLINILLGRE